MALRPEGGMASHTAAETKRGMKICLVRDTHAFFYSLIPVLTHTLSRLLRGVSAATDYEFASEKQGAA